MHTFKESFIRHNLILLSYIGLQIHDCLTISERVEIMKKHSERPCVTMVVAITYKIVQKTCLRGTYIIFKSAGAASVKVLGE
jgi:hypothetical protein